MREVLNLGGYDFNRINELDEEYGKRLNECSFAGEIVLEEDELLKLCCDLKNYSKYLQDNKLNNVILIMCVNIAYYYYDDSGFFWQHFHDLCDLNSEYFTNTVIGDKVEKNLLCKNLIQFNIIFRYVGAILEQIGITKYNIPIVAAATKELINNME